MKIGLQTWGSHGDIRPLLALAGGLQTAGHDVTLAITSIDKAIYESSISHGGVKIQMISSPLIQNSGELRNIEAEIFSQSDPVKQTQVIIEKLFLPAESAMYEAAEQLCEDNDLVIGHFFHYPMNVAAELSGRNYISVALVHSAIPSSSQPPAGLPNLGGWGNRLMWLLVKSVLNKKLKKYPDQLRMKHGMPPARDLIEDVWASKLLTLVAVSPQICTISCDWPGHYKICGFLNTRELPSEGIVSEDLLTFISKGDSPIYMTFGSVMLGGNQEETIALLCEAAEKASARAIIQAPGWSESGFKSSTTVHFVDAAPHAAIFPQCKAIVHHGGAGTTHSALHAGKPSIVVAHTSEQEFWGRELMRIGASTKPIPRRKLTSEQLARNIILTVGSKEISGAASRIGTAMSRENGVETAVRLISEKFSA